MPRRSAAPTADVPFLHRKQIEAEANLLIAEYEEQIEAIVALPVPIDELAEIHLHLTLEYLDMRSLFPQADVHGAIWFQEGRVGIDKNLARDTNPAKLGRYHFTLAHEKVEFSAEKQQNRSKTCVFLQIADRFGPRKVWENRSNSLLLTTHWYTS